MHSSENQGQEDSSTNDLLVVVLVVAKLRDLAADFAVADPRQASRNLAVEGDPTFTRFLQRVRFLRCALINPVKGIVVLATSR